MDDLHSTWSHRWLSHKAEARESAIHGLGVYAVEDIAEGEPVAVLGGVIVSTSDIKKYWDVLGHVGIQFDDEFFIVPTSREELKKKGVFNHSCDPNIGFRTSLTLVAIKDIPAGDELVFDYAFNETFQDGFECVCGSEQCRGKITPEDWKFPHIQEKYGAFFSPYLKEKIKKIS